jgi:ADP-heptose:LPS heptosyltransferase
VSKKILIIRFSSIGDIVLTTPVIRCVKQQIEDAEVHFVTKESFREVLTNNPYIDKLYTFKKDIPEIYNQLKAEHYDVVIDLHKNLRSFRLKKHLGVKSYSFDKINVQKFVAVNFKMTSSLPARHIVDRYFEAVKDLDVKSDGKGLDYFLNEKDKVDVAKAFFNGEKKDFVALVAGGSYYTKKIPLQKLEEICRKVTLPVIVVGDKSDAEVAETLAEKFIHVSNACGKFSINQSASIIQQSAAVITSDTGLMHIASAFKKRIFSLWGNTIPEFGMSPYLPGEGSRILETKISCRPCSKLGYHKCPKGHFRCMMELRISEIDL